MRMCLTSADHLRLRRLTGAAESNHCLKEIPTDCWTDNGAKMCQLWLAACQDWAELLHMIFIGGKRVFTLIRVVEGCLSTRA